MDGYMMENWRDGLVGLLRAPTLPLVCCPLSLNQEGRLTGFAVGVRPPVLRSPVLIIPWWWRRRWQIWSLICLFGRFP